MKTGRPHGLPQHLTPLIGRQQDIQAARQLLLHTARLITLIGPPGIGKTRLALAVAESVAGQFPDGVFFVDLSPIADPSLTTSAVCQALGVRQSSGTPLLRVLQQHLKGKRVLLVLDNFEHLMDAAPEIADLLSTCDDLRVLVSSRSELKLAWERSLPVPPLDLPDLHHLPPLESLVSCASVDLFVQRAQTANPDFGLSGHNAGTVAEICVRLEGVPLAIELAAAQTRLLQSRTILERLDHQLGLLIGTTSEGPARHRTLQAAIDWSYGLLDDAGRVLLDRLGVFAGGCTVEAAASVCGGGGLEPERVPDLLSTLRAKSLVVAESRDDGTIRYRLLEALRQYARERLHDGADAGPIQRAHAAYFVKLAGETEPNLTGPEQSRWLDLLVREQDNFRAALRWSIDHHQPEFSLRLAAVLFLFWQVRGSYAEGFRWLTEVCQATAERSTPRARLLASAAGLALFNGDYRSARSFYEESLAISRELDDRQGIAGSLDGLGIMAMDQGEYAQSRAFYEESLYVFRDLNDKRGIARSLTNWGLLEEGFGDPALSRTLLEESLQIKRELGAPRLVANALINLGGVVRRQGDQAHARALIEEGLAGVRALGEKRGISFALLHLGLVSQDQGDVASARALFEESLVLRRESGYTPAIPDCLEALAQNAGGRQPERATRLFGAAEALREAVGVPLRPADRAGYERGLAAARGALDEAAFAVAWAQGRALSLEQAVEYALKGDRHRLPERLSVRLLGDFEVRKGTEPIPNSTWLRRRDRLLFIYLLLAKEPAPREVLIETLWPEREPAAAGLSLNVAWSNLKRALEPDRAERPLSSYLVLKGGRYGLRGDAISTDVQEFDGRIALVRNARTPEDRVLHLEVAAALYRGDLLAQYADAPWITLERERIRLAYLGAVEQLAQVRFQQRRPEEGLEALRAILRLEPWREETYRALMQALADLGRRSEALHVYRECEELLRRELGVPPGAETSALFETIAAGRGTGPTSPTC